MKFLQFTQWYQPFVRRGDEIATQWPDKQTSIPVCSIQNICEDAEMPGCSLIWIEQTLGSANRPYRARESVTMLTEMINAHGLSGLYMQQWGRIKRQSQDDGQSSLQGKL